MGMRQKKIVNKKLKIDDHFSKPTNFPFSILKKLLKSEACKSGKIEAKGMDGAQPIWLSGCPEKGNFIAKNTNSALLRLKLSFSGQLALL